MESLTEDLWTMVLARLPIKIFTGFKLVSKQWKSIVESPFFRDVFMSLRQNSPSSSWSLMCRSYVYLEMVDPETVGHYQCETWGLNRSLGSFIESFLADKQQKHKGRRVSVEAYSDAGLILIHIESTFKEKGVIYVANPVSRECVEIFLDPSLPIGFETIEPLWQWGLVTRIENGHLLDYKVVIFDTYTWDYERLSYLIYSSETGLWSLKTLHHPFMYIYYGHLISLNGNLHVLGQINDYDQAVLSMDFHATSTGSDRCRVTRFPDLEKTTKFKRVCTPCQGFLHYMNIVDGSKLCLWRLLSEGWQLLSEISPGLDYLPLMMNPLDAKTAYFWSTKRKLLLAINLHNGKKFVIHKQCEGKSDGRIMFSVNDTKAMISIKSPIERVSTFGPKHSIPFVLPQWLHRIPSIKQPTTTATLHG